MQIIIILETFKDFFAGKFVLGANHHYPLSWKNSKTSSPAKFSQTQIIIILKIFKDFFAFKDVLAAYHHYPLSWKHSKTFSLANCLGRKSSLSWNYSKTFSPAKVSATQIIIMQKVFKDFFACKIVFDANHHYPEIIQRLFRLQNCLSRKSSLSWKHSKTFLPAKMSSTQIIIKLKVFKDFFACKIVFDANHHYPENIQRLFRLQNCLRRKSPLTWKYSKTFSLAKLS